MKFLFDFLPLILFFAAFKVAGIFVATAVAIAATVVQIGWALARRKKVAGMQWTSLAVIVVFGGATLLLHDETFIKWKPTVLYWTGGAAFLASLALRRNLARSIMGAEIELPEAIWTRLCVAWGVFFLFAGVLNLYVAYNFPTGFWVNFKVFGSLALIAAFVIAQSFWISRYLPDEDGKTAGAGPNPPPKA
ncbi:MAG TPA: septation protein A [Usitatibacter sp.]|nr:septation protein A [Usitatibacter sp.]